MTTITQWALSHIPCEVVDGAIRQETMCRVIFNQVDVVRLASGYPQRMVLFMTAGSSAYLNLTTLSITAMYLKHYASTVLDNSQAA